MHKYIAKRLLLMIPVIVGISFIIFSIMSFMPGNPARLILGEKATADAIAALNEQMGLNDPFIIRYFRYMGDVLTGNFGISYRTGMPVVEDCKTFSDYCEACGSECFLRNNHWSASWNSFRC